MPPDYFLPQPLQSFFYNHIDYITQESTVPDVRKYTMNDKAEGPSHFIDVENFGPVDSLPKTLSEAKTRYDEKFLQQNGILPWYMEEMMEKLTKEFKKQTQNRNFISLSIFRSLYCRYTHATTYVI